MEGKGVPGRPRRAQSYFGIHFDFHATAQDTGIGKAVTEEMIETLIGQVKPDFLQCDCKGHPGFSSYPTKAGNAAPGIEKDALRVWRDVTARHGVALYMHYSGVWDTEAVRQHPEWARVDETGAPDPNNTSVFGPYVDELMIPQLRELRGIYGVDGVWVDGDCWATNVDYGRAVVDAFAGQTGIREGIRPGEAHFLEFLEFCREGFRTYLKHYVDTLHRLCPGFEVASNWAYTSLMPEPAGADVDFCSGDMTPQNGVNAARFEARCLAHQGRPWDLMSWGFSSRFPEDESFSVKSPVQLMQEAAVVISQGGGYQIYYTQKPDGSVKLWQAGVMAELAAFLRARQPHCHRARPVPQVALLLPTTQQYRELGRPFGAGCAIRARTAGILQCLLDGQNCVDILTECEFERSMGRYPLVVLPECTALKDGLREKLTAYAEAGGSVLVIGAAATAFFARELGVTVERAMTEPSVIRVESGGMLGGLKTAYCEVAPGPGTKAFGKIFLQDDFAGDVFPAASIRRAGRGIIAGVHFDLGERYLHGATPVMRDFMSGLVRALFPDPVAEVSGSHFVDVCVNRLDDGTLAVNLVNTAGTHANADVYVYDEVPPVGPLRITVMMESIPRKVLLEPGREELPFTYEDGKVRLTLEKLEIHRVIALR